MFIFLSTLYNVIQIDFIRILLNTREGINGNYYAVILYHPFKFSKNTNTEIISRCKSSGFLLKKTLKVFNTFRV